MNSITLTEETLNALVSRQEVVLNRINKIQEEFMSKYNAVLIMIDTIFDHVSIITDKISELEAYQRAQLTDQSAEFSDPSTPMSPNNF